MVDRSTIPSETFATVEAVMILHKSWSVGGLILSCRTLGDKSLMTAPHVSVVGCIVMCVAPCNEQIVGFPAACWWTRRHALQGLASKQQLQAPWMCVVSRLDPSPGNTHSCQEGLRSTSVHAAGLALLAVSAVSLLGNRRSSVSAWAGRPSSGREDHLPHR